MPHGGRGDETVKKLKTLAEIKRLVSLERVAGIAILYVDNLYPPKISERYPLLLEVTTPGEEFEHRNNRTHHLAPRFRTPPELDCPGESPRYVDKDVCINERSFCGRHVFPTSSSTAWHRFARQ
jgi:hypothetical protein